MKRLRMLNRSSNKLAAIFLVLLFFLGPGLAYARDSCNPKVENCAHLASVPECAGAAFTAAIGATAGMLLTAAMAYKLIYAPEPTGITKKIGFGC